MAFLAFILDLRTLSPRFLKLIKDCLLQFANMFALSSLKDRIAICYLQSDSELKVAYSPESFNLLDWHDAVNRLSCCYSAHLLERTTLPRGGNLALILNDRRLVSARRKETKGKIILIGACIQSKVHSTVILQDAAGRDNYVESVILKNYDIDNSPDAFLQDELEMDEKTKKWIEELKDDRGLAAIFSFQRTNNRTLSCRLFSSSNQILNEFFLCKAHGYHQMFNSTTIDEDTLLEEESRNCEKLEEAPFAVRFRVIGRTGLTSLDKGLVIGRPYWVIPEVSSHVIAFEKLCYTLAIKQEGLICQGPFNLDTMKFFDMPHFYLLEPCVGGRMVLKRLAGAEETIPCPKFPEFPSRSLSDGAIAIPDDMLDNVGWMAYEGKLGNFHTNLNQLIKNRKHGHGCVCCRSGGGGLIHEDVLSRKELT